MEPTGPYSASMMRDRTGRDATILRLIAFAGGIAGPIAFAVAVTIGGLVRPGYSPIHQAISDLGVGPNGPALDATGVATGVLLIVFAGAFAHSMRPVFGAWWLGAALLGVRGGALVMTATFTEAPATLPLHVTGSVIGLSSLVLALLVIGLGLWSARAWRRWGAFTLAMLVLTALLVAFENVAFRRGAPVGSAELGGLAERALWAVSLTWFVALGWRLSIGSRGKAPARR
jgi:hypothetical membrane protein